MRLDPSVSVKSRYKEHCLLIISGGQNPGACKGVEQALVKALVGVTLQDVTSFLCANGPPSRQQRQQ